ncbi:hypothetical protein AAG570_005203 [Ranatra chinensis]|uniref:Uncharacterized protein n=1 Tax=Ranatra chinensis TaxID=642074 RepID=A0ABD0XZT8_9HEMI
MASKRRNMFYENKKQEMTKIVPFDRERHRSVPGRRLTFLVKKQPEDAALSHMAVRGLWFPAGGGHLRWAPCWGRIDAAPAPRWWCRLPCPAPTAASAHSANSATDSATASAYRLPPPGPRMPGSNQNRPTTILTVHALGGGRYPHTLLRLSFPILDERLFS